MKSSRLVSDRGARGFDLSREYQGRLDAVVPGGSHTYAKGTDQFPENMAPIIERGEGCHVWDVDGNEYIEYANGLRSVVLGHAFKPVVEAVHGQMLRGNNFNRPARLEVECAEAFIDHLGTVDMVKFAKNGSDATSAAIKLARAYTGRDLIAVCKDHPFFSVDDWFMCTTPLDAGIPEAYSRLTTYFPYDDLETTRALFEAHPGRIACLILEGERLASPSPGYLHALQDLCHEHGALLVLDEIVTGFRFNARGLQHELGLRPDLAAFGKAMGNGFAVSALAGKREIMELGGLHHGEERVFLLSLTHGAEASGLAACMATIDVFQKHDVVGTLNERGAYLKQLIDRSVEEHRLEGYFGLVGRPSALYFNTRDHDHQPSQPFRTLFLQEILKRGVLAPSLMTSFSHTERDIEETAAIFHEALGVYRKAMDEGVEKYLEGESVKPVYRKYN